MGMEKRKKVRKLGRKIGEENIGKGDENED